MEFKPDWEDAREHFLAWWEGEVIDRVAMSVRAPNGTTPRPLPEIGEDEA